MDLTKRQNISDAFLRMPFYIDTRDWQKVEQCFAGKMQLDYTSLFGGEVQILTPAEVVEQWKALVPGFDSTQHHMTIVGVDDINEGVEVIANVTATHSLTESSNELHWTIGGYYVANLIEDDGQWKISSLKLVKAWVSGDNSIVEKAQARAHARAA